MAALSDMLLGLVKPALGRVFTSLGISALTITGVDAAFNTVRDRVISEFNKADLAILQLAGLAGAWDALGLIFGACGFAVSYWALTKALSFTSASSS